MRICPHCKTLTESRTCPTDGFHTVDAAVHTQKSPVDPLLGQDFEGRYRIDKLLGKGGMGSVYRATQHPVGRPVALKVLHKNLAANLKEVARFQQEARAIAALRHPNAIKLIDFGQARNGSLFLVMEFLKGEPLGSLIAREAPLNPNRVVAIARQVLEVLAEAHDHGIVHRDLKPENLFLDQVMGKQDFVKVLDFGIAKVTGDTASQTNLTAAGIALGSPRYMSPEQARAKAITPQTDFYALGIIMYEMLCGRPIFDCSSPTDYILSHVQDPPNTPTVDGVEIEGPLVDFVMRCLAKDPADRPASALAAIEALDDLGGTESITGKYPVKDDDPTLTDGANTAAMQQELSRRVAAHTTGEAPAGVATGVAPADQPVPSMPRRRRGLWLAAAAMVLVGAGATLAAVLAGGSGPADPIPDPTTADPVAQADVSEAAPDTLAPESPADTAVAANTAADVTADTTALVAAAASDAASEPGPDTVITAIEATADTATPTAIERVVTLRLSPPNATVWIDGTRIGRGTKAHPTVEVSWSGDDPPAVRVRRRGYRSQRVRLSAAQTGETLDVELVARKSTTTPAKPEPDGKNPYEIY